ncbi:hypothetical protein VCHC72A2_02669A, partial [Vibrio cholerae HC-72A2]
MVFKPFI